MLNVKTKLISTVMGVSMLGSTGLASVVHACPVNTGNANAKPGISYKASPVNINPGVVYRTSYSDGSFTSHLSSLVNAGVINSYQESKVLDVFNAGGNLRAGLDNLVSSDVINSYQETRILDYSSSVTYTQSNENFKAELNRMLSAGELNSDQHKKMMELYNAGGDFKTGLDDLVSKGVINSNQHAKIFDSFKKYPKQNNSLSSNTQQNPTPARNIAPAPVKAATQAPTSHYYKYLL